MKNKNYLSILPNKRLNTKSMISAVSAICVMMTATALAPSEVSAAGTNNGDYRHVRLYTHGFRNSSLFTAEQETFLRDHSRLLTIEKRHNQANYSDGNRGEAQTKAQMDRLASAAPNTLGLFYWNVILDWNYPLEREDGKVIEDYYEVKTPSAYLLNTESLEPKKSWKTQKYFNLGKSAARTWWVQTARSAINRPNIDGIFVDALPKAVSMDWEDYALDMCRRLPAQKILIYNGCYVNDANATLASPAKFLKADYDPVTGADRNAGIDGVFVEAFFSGPCDTREERERLIRNLLYDVPASKYIICRGSEGSGVSLVDGKSVNLDRNSAFRFAMASYLLVSNNKTYFMFGGYNPEVGESSFTWQSEYDKMLCERYKKPRPAYQSPTNRWIWKRQYQYCEVKVNLNNPRGSRIFWTEEGVDNPKWTNDIRD
ncbi:MAG TPA: hypothetical protein DCX06_10875 [Opitutae bacterium]|nr:hypothetical protein [Opitutae bacterium]